MFSRVFASNSVKLFGFASATGIGIGMVGNDGWKEEKSVYDFSYTDIDGVEQSMARYKGHVLVVVNLATKWSRTPVNYTQLTELHNKYAASEGFRVLGFPCNQFGGQEPGSNSEIKHFAQDTYHVKWDLASKTEVNGEGAHPLWKYLRSTKIGYFGDSIKWNFTKFVIDKNGQVVGRFAPATDPIDMEDFLKAYFGQWNSQHRLRLFFHLNDVNF